MNTPKYHKKLYGYQYLIPAGLIYSIFFLFPTLFSFFFSLTRWTLFDWEFTGLENYIMFFQESSLSIGFTNTLVYAGLTAGLKVLFGFLIAVWLTGDIKFVGTLRSIVFFPTILSTIAIGITFSNLMHPSKGLINIYLSFLGLQGPDWLGNPDIALLSVVLVDVWKGVGMAAIIFMAGIKAIPGEFYEALSIDGGGKKDALMHITLPLSRSAMNSVIILALIGGLRTFDLVWAMTKGGPGFSTDLIASIIYKQYQGGFYGLATAGNVILFFMVMFIAMPIYRFLTKKEVHL